MALINIKQNMEYSTLVLLRSRITTLKLNAYDMRKTAVNGFRVQDHGDYGSVPIFRGSNFSSQLVSIFPQLWKMY